MMEDAAPGVSYCQIRKEVREVPTAPKLQEPAVAVDEEDGEARVQPQRKQALNARVDRASR